MFESRANVRHMIGDLHETLRGWLLEAPTECVHGHQFGPNRVLVGHQPCTCQGSHMGWTCRACDETLFWPPVGATCSVLNGAARVR